jgi:hypothetical protein
VRALRPKGVRMIEEKAVRKKKAAELLRDFTVEVLGLGDELVGQVADPILAIADAVETLSRRCLGPTVLH